jgi:hypothetical protein
MLKAFLDNNNCPNYLINVKLKMFMLMVHTCLALMTGPTSSSNHQFSPLCHFFHFIPVSLDFFLVLILVLFIYFSCELLFSFNYSRFVGCEGVVFCNLNIGFMTKCEMQRHMRSRECVWV